MSACSGEAESSTPGIAAGPVLGGASATGPTNVRDLGTIRSAAIGALALLSPASAVSRLPAGSAKIVRARVGLVEIHLISDATLARKLLSLGHDLVAKGPSYGGMRELLGDGVLTGELPGVAAERRATAGHLSGRSMPDLVGTVDRIVARTVGRWQKQGEIDPAFEARQLAARAVMAAMFSHEPADAAADRALTAAVEHNFRLVGSGGALRPMADVLRAASRPEGLGAPGRALALIGRSAADTFDTLQTSRYDPGAGELHSFAISVIAQRRTLRAEGTRIGDLLDTLLDASELDKDDERHIGANRVRAAILHVMTSGSETTGTTLTRVMHHMADLAERGSRATEEGDGREAERLVNETLRLDPPAWAFARTALEEIRLDGHTIPPGATIVISPLLTQRSGTFAADPRLKPDLFLPERWSDQMLDDPPDEMLAFGAGRRGCTGEDLARTILVRATKELILAGGVHWAGPLRPTIRRGFTGRTARHAPVRIGAASP